MHAVSRFVNSVERERGRRFGGQEECAFDPGGKKKQKSK